MKQVINPILYLFFSTNFWAQTGFVSSKEEPRSYYRLQVYPNGLDRDSMEAVHTKLLKTPKIHWKKEDSISFMLTSISLENYDDAMDFYQRKDFFEPQTQEDFHLIQYLLSYKRRFSKLPSLLQKEAEKFPNNRNQIKYRLRIKTVEAMVIKGDWSFADSIIFPELQAPEFLTIMKGSKDYEVTILPLIKIIDEALRTETKYEFSSNQTLGLAFFEFGIFLRKNLSITDAFVVLSVGRFYDKLNFDLNNFYKEIRREMSKKQYIFPSMRKIFPKQSQGIFSAENIERRQIKLGKEEELDQPYYMEMEADNQDSIISRKFGSLVMLVGISVLLFFVIFFVKIKRN